MYLPRSLHCSDFISKNLLFWKSGCLQEVVAQGVLTVSCETEVPLCAKQKEKQTSFAQGNIFYTNFLLKTLIQTSPVKNHIFHSK